jgi:hypothetical protein
MDFACFTQSFQCGTIKNGECWNRIFPRQVFSSAGRSRFVPMRENMRQNCLHFKKRHVSLLQFLIGIRMATLLPLAAGALGLAVSLSPVTAHAQEYPWCVSRESYLYCFYKTQEQCQWIASGHRRLCFESAFAFLEQAARFQPDPLSDMK